jgi:hypothetical protein
VGRPESTLVLAASLEAPGGTGGLGIGTGCGMLGELTAGGATGDALPFGVNSFTDEEGGLAGAGTSADGLAESAEGVVSAGAGSVAGGGVC